MKEEHIFLAVACGVLVFLFWLAVKPTDSNAFSGAYHASDYSSKPWDTEI